METTEGRGTEVVERQPQGSTGDLEATVAQYRARKNEFDKAVGQMEKRIRKRNGRLELEVTDPAQIDVDPTLFQVLKEALDETNRRAQARDLDLDALQLATPVVGATADQPAARATNYSGQQTFWWGYRLFLNEADTHTMIKLIALGGTAAVAGFLASVIGAVAAATVAVISGIAVLVLQTICAGGGHDGIFFNFAWPAIPWGVWSQ